MAAATGTITAFTSVASSPISRTPAVDTGASLLMLLVGNRFGTTTGISGITVAGNAMTLLRETSIGSASPVDAWYLISPPTGTPAVSITHANGNPIFSGAFVPVLGSDTSTPFRTQTGSVGYVEGGGNPSLGPSLALAVAAGDLALGIVEFVSDTDVTVTTSDTSLVNQRTTSGANSGEVSVQAAAVASGTSKTLSWTLGSAVNNMALAVSIVAAAGGGGSTAANLLMLGVG